MGYPFHDTLVYTISSYYDRTRHHVILIKSTKTIMNEDFANEDTDAPNQGWECESCCTQSVFDRKIPLNLKCCVRAVFFSLSPVPIMVIWPPQNCIIELYAVVLYIRMFRYATITPNTKHELENNNNKKIKY